MVNRFDVFLIGDGEKRPFSALERMTNFGFNVVPIPANFISTYPSHFHKQRSLARSRRILTLGEIGCSISHLDVYSKFLATGTNICVVMEDDAYLLESSVTKFSIIMSKIQDRESEDPSVPRVYSFYSESAILGNSKYMKEDFFKVFGEPANTVAYAINRLGALKLSQANALLDFQADWPRNSGVHFLFSKDRIFSHGDPGQVNYSHLSSCRTEVRFSKSKKFFLAFRTLFLIEYFTNKFFFLNFSEYLKVSFFPIIRWQLLNLISKNFGKDIRGLRTIIGTKRVFNFHN